MSAISPFTQATDEISEEDQDAIADIAERIRNGDCILFMGAGVNASSPDYADFYRDEDRPPSGSELTKILRDELKERFQHEFKDENNITLSRVAQYYELLSRDRIPLVRTLKKYIYDGKKPSAILTDLAEMPFEFIITTNYDQLFEQALAIKGKAPHVGIYHNDRLKKTDNFLRKDITTKSPFLYKIHGDIITDRQSIVITDEDYIQFILRMSDKDDYNPVPRVFADALSEKSILFIGYRLMDYNLRLLFKTIRWGKDPNSMPLNYSIDPAPDLLIRPLFYNNYKTNFLVLDSWKIIPMIHKEVFK